MKCFYHNDSDGMSSGFGIYKDAEFVELNPLVDVDNKTTTIAVNLIETLLIE